MASFDEVPEAIELPGAFSRTRMISASMEIWLVGLRQRGEGATRGNTPDTLCRPIFL